MQDPQTPGRRQRSRERTERVLKEAALAEVREHGAPMLTLRGVARRAGMSPAGLYRYVDSRDGLLTWLIADGYNEYAEHLEEALAAADGDITDRMRAVGRAYRSWAVQNPHAFGLLFGDPVPGYAAPPEGPTVEGMRRLGGALATPLLEAHHHGRLQVVEPLTDATLDAELHPMRVIGGDLPPGVYALLLLAWGRMHGQVSLEVFGHHAWLFPDGCESLYHAELEAMLLQLMPSSAGDPVGPA